VIDDEAPFARALSISLRARTYDVDVALTGEEGLRLIASLHPDLVLLDLGLPGLDGIDVLRGLRGWTEVPVIVLSARHGESTKVDAFDAGADDYITKPFGMAELLARVRSTLRRRTVDERGPIVETAHVRIDFEARRAHRDHDEIHLTPIDDE